MNDEPIENMNAHLNPGSPSLRNYVNKSSKEIENVEMGPVSNLSSKTSLTNTVIRTDRIKSCDALDICTNRVMNANLSENPHASNEQSNTLADGMVEVPNEMPNISSAGFVHQISVMTERQILTFNRIKRQIELLKHLLKSNNTDLVNAELTNLDNQFFELLGINTKLVELCPPDAASSELISSADEMVFNMKREVADWLLELEKRNNEEVRSGRQSGRASSVASSRSSSNRSRKSNRSASSVCSIRNKARLAELTAKRTALEDTWKAEMELEIQQLRQKRMAEAERELMSIKKEITFSKAKQEVFDAEERATAYIQTENPPTLQRSANEAKCQQQRPSHPKSSSVTERVSPKEITTQDDVCYSHFTPDTPINTKVSDIKKLATPQIEESNIEALCDTMSKMVKMQSAPVVDVDIFEGDHLKYHMFRANFKDLVESTVDDERGRLNRLIKFTAGEAKELVNGYILDESGKCYSNALSALDEEYGNVYRVASAYNKQLRGWPTIRNNDAKGCKQLLLFLKKCKIMKVQGILTALDTAENLRNIVSKFSSSVQDSWNKQAMKIQLSKKRQVEFNDLLEFIEFTTLLMNNPEFSRDAFNELRDKRPSYPNNLKNFGTKLGDSVPCDTTSCGLCKDEHFIESCTDYLKLSSEDRMNLVKSNRLCFSCLLPTNSGHYSRICKSKLKCNTCQEVHPTSLHEYHQGQIKVANTKTSEGVNDFVSLNMVQVHVFHKSDPEKILKVYALLDECSQGTFIDEAVLKELDHGKSRSTEISIETMTGALRNASRAIDGLAIHCNETHERFYPKEIIDLPTTYSHSDLPIKESDLPTRERIKNWSHLYRIIRCLPVYDPNIPIGLLIGANCPKALQPQEVIASKNNGPYATRSSVGWTIIGPMGKH